MVQLNTAVQISCTDKSTTFCDDRSIKGFGMSRGKLSPFFIGLYD